MGTINTTVSYILPQSPPACAYLSTKLISGMAERCHGNGQAGPSEDQVSLHGNTRRAPKDVETRPALVVTNTEASPVTIVRGETPLMPQRNVRQFWLHIQLPTTAVPYIGGQHSRRFLQGSTLFDFSVAMPWFAMGNHGKPWALVAKHFGPLALP